MGSSSALSGRVALVTGGGRGIGRAVVETLLAEGYRVGFTWSSGEAAARAVAESSDGRARAYQFDLRDRERPAALVAEVEKDLGPLFGLVNNAAVRREGILAMTRDGDWDEVVDVNLNGAFRLCRAAVPGMVHRRKGAIVNVSSRSAVASLAGQASYGASKAGLLGLTRSLAREVGRKGVRVNAVVPGFVATDSTADMPPDAVKSLRAGECIPAGTRAVDVAHAVVFLLSDRAAAITGQALQVDCGASA